VAEPVRHRSAADEPAGGGQVLGGRGRLLQGVVSARDVRVGRKVRRGKQQLSSNNNNNSDNLYFGIGEKRALQRFCFRRTNPIRHRGKPLVGGTV